jgi:hypothetical protein
MQMILIARQSNQKILHLPLTNPKYFRSCVRVGAGTQESAHDKGRSGTKHGSREF